MLKPEAASIFASFLALSSKSNRLLAEYIAAHGVETSGPLRTLVAQLMANAYLEVLRPLEKLFPELNPFETDGGAADSELELLGWSRSYEEFMNFARQTLNLHSEALIDGEASGLFRRGTVQDLIKPISGIERFTAPFVIS